VAGILFWAAICFIAYVYAGYPLLVWWLSSLRTTQQFCEGPPAPGVTLLIAAYNEAKVIREKLENSLLLDYPRERLQILVADDGSQDETADIVRSFADRGVELSSASARQGKVSAINRAVQQAHNEIILFSDANNFYAPDAVREIIKPFSNPRVGAVSGSRVVQFDAGNERLGRSEGIYWRYESFIKEQESRLGCCIGVSGEQLALRKDLFIAPPAGIINDDFYIALQVMRQGYDVVYAPQARSRENASSDQKDEVVRKTRIIAGRYQIIGLSLPLLPFHRPLLVWQIISHKYLRPFVPFFMLVALIANIFALFTGEASGPAMWLGLHPPVAYLIIVAQVLFYLLALIGSLPRPPRGLLGRVVAIPAYLVSSNYAAVLGLIRYMNGQQTALWKKVAR